MLMVVVIVVVVVVGSSSCGDGDGIGDDRIYDDDDTIHSFLLCNLSLLLFIYRNPNEPRNQTTLHAEQITNRFVDLTWPKYVRDKQDYLHIGWYSTTTKHGTAPRRRPATPSMYYNYHEWKGFSRHEKSTFSL